MQANLGGIIFDFDGLILDTETPIYDAWRECYAHHGHDLPVATYAQCVGSDFADYDPAAELEKLLDRDLDWKELDELRRRRVHEILETDPQPLPGVEALLLDAKAAGVPCAIASSSPRIWVEPWVERLGLRDYFQHIVTVDDVNRPKPSPELFITAAQRLEQEHGRLVILEDSFNGLRAAMAAEIPCVIVPNGITQHYDFEGAHLQVESLHHAGLEILKGLFPNI